MFRPWCLGHVKGIPVIPAPLPSLAFQAMRFPPKSYNKDLESAEVSENEGWMFSEEKQGRT